MTTYDALLFVSFGGPEGPDDVIPFLENVLRGKNVPRERMLEVAEHYHHFGGVSPINDQNRALIAAIEGELKQAGINLPVYWGNRNWHPLLPATLEQMAKDGVKRALAFFTSTFSCYSGCRQYRENIEDARQVVGPDAPIVQKLRMPYNHPGFIEAQADLVRQSLAKLSRPTAETLILFCAHSIPLSMAENSKYEMQLREAARLICEAIGHPRWELVYQSRSGPPQQPWLEPDVCDRIEELHTAGQLENAVIVPLGFVSDHMEVMYDLDVEAADTCKELGIDFQRAPSVSTHPRYIRMIRELVEERIAGSADRPALGSYGASHDVCPENCCLYPRPTSGPGGRPDGRPGARPNASPGS